ncbi:Oxygen sensor protein DosP [compost metagenome]
MKLTGCVRVGITVRNYSELNLIAEGVETESQFEFFNEYNCDEIQGYYFYKPMPALEIEGVF